MSRSQPARVALLCGVTWLIFGCAAVQADDPADLREELNQLRTQNATLAKQLQEQQTLIDNLSRKVGEIQRAGEAPNPEAEPRGANQPTDDLVAKPGSPFTVGRLNLSGEGGVAFLRTGREGMFPHDEFRIDEARLFVEAPVLDNVYFFGEINLATREEPDVQARLGEVYVEVENVSRLWNMDHMLNVRAGRMYIPFGEEYLTRYAIDNSFISHSLSDLWGVDEGLELYGRAGKLCYAAAVQNGGIPDTADFTSDKSVAGRLGFDPTSKLHLSLSGMRTGQIDVQQDQLSALWFGNGFLRSVGSRTTTRFQADLVEGDVQVRLPRGQLGAFGGYLHYQDNDPAGSNRRDVYYYSVEGVHDIIGKLYGGVRFSQILADRGFPIVGNGDFGDYFFGTLTMDIWRLSLDVGYRWSQNLVLKAEYSFERGTTVAGDNRNSEDLFALEAAFKF